MRGFDDLKNTWAICFSDGALATDEYSRVHVYATKKAARRALAEVAEEFGVWLEVRRVDVR